MFLSKSIAGAHSDQIIAMEFGVGAFMLKVLELQIELQKLILYRLLF
jgi:hypothetical protein